MSVMTQIGIRDRATAVLNRIRTATSRVNQMFDNTRNSVTRAERSVTSFGSVATRVLSGISAAFALSRVTELADTFTNISARLDLMNDGLQTTKQLQQEIMASANRSRAAYALTADSIAKMGVMARDAFSNNQELIAFTELINKQFTIAGTSSAGKDAAMLQLTQAMGAGVLRGEELNSIFEQAPTIIQTIADYLDVPIGKIRSMAEEGQITATIVKNAMLTSADEINERFNSIPLTFVQVADLIKNTLLNTFMPLIQVIGKGAAFINDHWETIAPVFYAVGAAAAFLAVALNAQMIATTAAAFATQLFSTTLLGCPLGWIALVIGVIVGALYKWIQGVGGVQVAWLMLKNTVLTAVESIKLAVFGAYVTMANTWSNICVTFETAKVAIQNSVANMAQGVLNTLQDMANGAIDIINKFIGVLNKIEGVSISPIEHLTFAAKNQALTDAQNQARTQGLNEYKSQMAAQQAQRAAELSLLQRKIDREQATREREIAATKAGATGTTDWANALSSGGMIDVGNVGSVGSIDSAVSISEEDLKYLRDIAEAEVINRFTTAEIRVEMNNNNNISSEMDLDGVVDYLAKGVNEAMEKAAEGVHE